jgi:alpha-mannosidase
MNDSKYGYSVRDGNVGLSLLKASKFPNDRADMGKHEFVYSVLPHERPLEESNVFAEAHKLNTPIWIATFDKPETEEERVGLQC